MKKTLCMLLALLLAFGATALAEGGDLQAQLDAANARIAELEAEVEKYKPYYDKQIVAEYGEDGIIWRDDAMVQYQAAADTYAQYGLKIDDYAAEVKQDILTMLVRDAILDGKAAELGVSELDDATKAELEKEATDTFETYVESYKSYFASDGASDEDARAQTIEQLGNYGVTVEALTEQMVANYVDEQLYKAVTADVAVTDEEVQSAYGDMVKAAQEDFTDDRTYNSARGSGEPIAWNPEGYRAVKHVLIQFSDDQSNQYSELKRTLDSLNGELDALDDDAEEAPAEGEEPAAPKRSREEIEDDKGKVVAEIEALYSQLLPDAQKVIDEFEAGADFDSLIEKYGQDSGMQKEPVSAIGYAVSADSTTWDHAFTEGAMSIAEPGQISGPVYGSYGIHVIYYMSDIPAGAVPFEELAADAEAIALQSKTDDAYNAQVEAWVEEAAPVYYVDRF